MKPMTRFADATADAVGRQFDIDTERRKRIRRARARRQRAIAMLRHRHSGARHDKGGAGGNIIGAGRVASCTDDVDRASRGLHAQHLVAHCRDRAGEFIHGFATHPQSHQQRAHLRGRRFARHHAIEAARGFIAAERRAGRCFGDERLEFVGHGCLNAPRGGGRAQHRRSAGRSRHSMPRPARGNF